MSDSPLLNKMDALLKKHRGGDNSPDASSARTGSPERTPPPNAWLPVLTQVIERGTPPAVPAMTAPAAVATSAEPEVHNTAVNDSLTEQLMGELAPRLSEAMEKQVAAELRKNLDQTVASLLSQLDVNVREIVRDAVAEKLNTPRDPGSK
jgi:hypothetical protein